MALLSFYVDDFHTVDLGSSGLVFSNASTLSPIPQGSYQNNTFVSNSAGTVANLEINNTKWLHPNSGSVNGGVAQSLLAIPNYLSTVNIRFTHSSPVKVRNWKFRASSRSNVADEPGSGLTVQAAEIIHPNQDFSVSGSGDSSWVTLFGSGSVLDITSSPGMSGHYINGPSTADTRHDAYVVLSCKANDGGNKLFKIYSELEYLEPRGSSITNWYYVVEGDSISVANGFAGGPWSYARAIVSGSAPYGINGVDSYRPAPAYGAFWGIAGTNQSDMEGRLSGVLPDIVNNVPTHQMVIISTHMGNGLIELSPENLWLRSREYWNKVRASGAKCIEITILHRSGVFAPGWAENPETVIRFNNYVKADRSLFDELYDTSLYSYGQPDAASNSGLFSDGVHPTQYLYDIMFHDLVPKFDNVLSPDRPQNSRAPFLSGTFRYGDTVMCHNGDWTFTHSLNNQWFRGSGLPNPISGATSTSYQIQPIDVGSPLKCNTKASHNGIDVYKATPYSSPVTSYYYPELVQNNQFGSNNATGYTAAGGATFFAVSGRLVMTGHGNSNARVSQTITTVSGAWYEFKNEFFFGVNQQAGKTFCQNGVGGTTLFTIDYPRSGVYSMIFQASGTSTYFDWRDPATATSGTNWMWDKITCRRLSSGIYDQFVAEDFSKTTYTVSHANTTASGGPGNGPIGASTEYSIFMPVDTYHYKTVTWLDQQYFNSDVGDKLLLKIAISGATGQVIGIRADSTGFANYIVHTCNDTWQIAELLHPISGVANVFGFENRSAIIPSVGAASATFRVWGLSTFIGDY